MLVGPAELAQTAVRFEMLSRRAGIAFHDANDGDATWHTSHWQLMTRIEACCVCVLRWGQSATATLTAGRADLIQLSRSRESETMLGTVPSE